MSEASSQDWAVFEARRRLRYILTQLEQARLEARDRSLVVLTRPIRDAADRVERALALTEGPKE